MSFWVPAMESHQPIKEYNPTSSSSRLNMDLSFSLAYFFFTHFLKKVYIVLLIIWTCTVEKVNQRLNYVIFDMEVFVLTNYIHL